MRWTIALTILLLLGCNQQPYPYPTGTVTYDKLDNKKMIITGTYFNGQLLVRYKDEQGIAHTELFWPEEFTTTP